MRNELFGALASYQSPAAPDAILPSITSPSATAVGSTTATLGGMVTSDGGEVASPPPPFCSASDQRPDSYDLIRAAHIAHLTPFGLLRCWA